MAGRRRTRLAVDAERRNAEVLARLGGEIRDSRRRKRLSQAQLGARAGIGRMSVSRAERGRGGGLTLDAWQRIGLAIDRPLVVRLQHDTTGETIDAAHAAMQELVLGTGRRAGFLARFEVPTRPVEPWRSSDVGLVDDRGRRLVLVECWNTIGDIGAASRSSDRKRSEATAVAAARWGTDEARIGTLWVVRATLRNRALVARYPELFHTRFPGSSIGWLRALMTGSEPPDEPGLVWCDVAATRLFAWRRPAMLPVSRR